MKCKQIEKQPYLPCGRIPKGKMFFAAAAAVQLGDDRILLIDLYSRSDRKTPKMRAAYKKTEWAVYTVNTVCGGYWSTGSIAERRSYPRTLKLIEKGKWASVKNTAIRKEDQDRIFRFVSGKKAADKPWNSWIAELTSLEDDINREKERKKHDRLARQMEERHADTPDVPEAFEKWLEGLLSGWGFLYYRKKREKAEVRCSRCGESWEGRYRTPDTFGQMFERRIEEPKANAAGTCRYCGRTGIYKPAGRMRGAYGVSVTGYLIQPYRGSGIVLREFIVEKIMTLDGPEDVHIWERSRAYFEGDREQTDWHLAGMCGDYWSYQNVGGMANLRMKDGAVWPGSWALIHGTGFGYSGCREYLAKKAVDGGKELCPYWYLWNYGHKRYMEMFVRHGMWKLVDASLQSYDGIVNAGAGNAQDLLGIYPYRMKLLAKYEGDLRMLRILREERSGEKHFTEEMIIRLWNAGMSGRDVEEIIRYMGITRFLNRVEKYAGKRLGDGPGAGSIARTYLDYLEMQEMAGADMTDQIIQHPRDLNAAHAALVTAANEKKNAEHIAEKEQRFCHIPERFEALSGLYGYEEGGMIIRPAETAGEIILEGQTLHHCVGGDTYLGKHDEGKTIIFFLRAAAVKDVPYITVELDPKERRILQWYGVRDTKPDKAAVQPWLDRWEGMIRDHGSIRQAELEESLKTLSEAAT